MKFPPFQNFSIDIIIIAHSAKSTSFRQRFSWRPPFAGNDIYYINSLWRMFAC